MRRPWLILSLGLLIAASAYAMLYLGFSARFRQACNCHPEELGWLKHEFDLSDTEFSRISKLHAAYLPRCQEMCGQIDSINQRLKALLAQSDDVTPEIEQALRESAQTRAECQIMMINHFYAVSRAMPEAQGKRYLEWMQSQVLTPTYQQADQTSHEAASHDHH